PPPETPAVARRLPAAMLAKRCALPLGRRAEHQVAQLSPVLRTGIVTHRGPRLAPGGTPGLRSRRQSLRKQPKRAPTQCVSGAAPGPPSPGFPATGAAGREPYSSRSESQTRVHWSQPRSAGSRLPEPARQPGRYRLVGAAQGPEPELE